MFNAVVHILLKSFSSSPAGEMTLQDAVLLLRMAYRLAAGVEEVLLSPHACHIPAVLLLSMAYCLAAGSRAGSTSDAQSAGLGTAWHSDQELAIKVDPAADRVVWH